MSRYKGCTMHIIHHYITISNDIVRYSTIYNDISWYITMLTIYQDMSRYLCMMCTLHLLPSTFGHLSFSQLKVGISFLSSYFYPPTFILLFPHYIILLKRIWNVSSSPYPPVLGGYQHGGGYTNATYVLNPLKFIPTRH